jgi:hypothetical protein
MSDPASEIRKAIDAIRRAAEADLAITQSAVREIERQVGVIHGLTKSREVEREGAYLVARALGRYTDRESKPAIILDARLQGAIGRFEYVLRQLGFLPAESPRLAPGAEPTRGPSGE